jgi:hypothetical protein
VIEGKIKKSGYYCITVTVSNGFVFKFPCRGYRLECLMAFQDSLKYSTYQVEEISEKTYLKIT